jgi:hypothetical protein
MIRPRFCILSTLLTEAPPNLYTFIVTADD